MLNPRVAFSRQVLSDVPDRALRPRKIDRPLIFPTSAYTLRQLLLVQMYGMHGRLLNVQACDRSAANVAVLQ